MSDGLTPDVQEQFWRTVVDVETAETTDLAKELNAIGVELPEPDDLDEVALHKALWRAIEGLARLRVFLDQTDHRSDRELYTQLLRELLPAAMPALDVDETSAWHIDVLGFDNPELYLNYYADEKTREFWRIDFPDDPSATSRLASLDDLVDESLGAEAAMRSSRECGLQGAPRISPEFSGLTACSLSDSE